MLSAQQTTAALYQLIKIWRMQVAFDAQMHELKLLMAADEKLWQLRGSVVSLAPDTAAPSGDISSPLSLQEPDWTPQQVR